MIANHYGSKFRYFNVNKKGCLYIVATPIGHLKDITHRAIEILKTVDCILAENTRHSRSLLIQLGISKKPLPLHEHNERLQAEKICNRILEGAHMALISDAGTPLISDPGYHLVRSAQAQGISVIPIPGPSALIAALSVSGLPTDSFIFEGFLSPKPTLRQKQLTQLEHEPRTLIFYEAPHRIVKTLSDFLRIFGGSREAVLARELTKTFETIRRATLAELFEWVQSDDNQMRGEIVLLVSGATKPAHQEEISQDALRILKIMLAELSVKQAAHLVSKITQIPKALLYDTAVKLKNKQEE